MRSYELAYIANPDMDEEARNALEARILGWVEAAGGKLVNIDRWGRRKLAYPLKDFRDGYYFFAQTELPASAPVAIEQDLKVVEEILRYMLVRKETA
ncbi:MAG TPA: 30S ribosomal protein S6 [Anaerolineales bacterium]|jgi:small subunit ribosomal protein S6